MKKLNYILVKLLHRLARRIYVLRKSPLKEWGVLLRKTERQILFDAIILRYDGSGKFQEEIDFLKEKKKMIVFPARNIKQFNNAESGYDIERNLPYVMHKNRKLYFARSWSQEKSAQEYKNFIEHEQILGDNYIEKAPHQYQSESFHVKSTDILLDVGCAEALFALDAIDKVKKVILFESDPVWFEPLKATFEKEIASGKVILIEKNAGKKNTPKSVTIASVLQNEEFESLFIKMDIEGSEIDVVKSCEDWMDTNKDIRFSCCTYHKKDHAKILKSIFEKHNYNIDFSDGYMLFFLDKHISYPYFRKGIIRATKKNTKEIALVEFFPYHGECLYSQLLFLKDSGHKITLVCHVKLQSIIENFDLNIKYLFFDFDKISALFQFRNYLIQNKVDIVILNTTQGSKVLRFFLLPFPRFINFYGIIHDTEKILKSTGQKIICRKLKAYYSLAEYIYLPQIKGLTSQYFETAFYPPYSFMKIDKKNDEIWVTIPGTVEYCRRNYEFLLTLAQHSALSENVKFVLLGNYRKHAEGVDFIAKIIDLKLENRFIYFDGFIKDKLFHSYIVASDFLLPLIHPDTSDAQSYLKYKISGMFPLSQAYNKTMLCHTIFAEIRNFNYRTLFYNSIDNIIPLINERKQNTDKFTIDFETNKQRYLSILQ